MAKILIISTMIFPVTPENRYAGIETLVRLIAWGMKDLGHQVSVAAPSGSKFEFASEHIDTGPCGDFIESERVAFSRYSHRVREFDAVLDFSHTHWAMYYQKIPGLAWIWHDPFIMKPQEPLYDICALSRWQADRFRTVYGYDPRVVDPHCSLVPAAKDTSPSGRCIFIGKMGPDKGCLETIRIAKTAGVPLDIVGVPGPGDPPEYLDKVKSLCDGSQIVYLGGVDDAEKYRLLYRAKALLYPVNYPAGKGEAHSHKMVDALMTGCPCITYDQGAMKEVIEDGVTGFTVANEEEFVDAIENVGRLSNQTVRERAGQRWSIAATCRRIDATIDEVIDGVRWGKLPYRAHTSAYQSTPRVLYQAEAKKYVLPEWPRQVRLDTINQCNARCIPCHLALQESRQRMMTEPIFQRIVDELAGWKKPLEEIVPVNFGEFFLLPNALEILQTISTHLPATMIALPTNGQLIKENDVEGLARIKTLRWLNFSVNAAFSDTYEAFMGLPASNILHVRSLIMAIRKLRPDIVCNVSMVFDTMYQTEIERDAFIDFWRGVVSVATVNPAHFADNPLKTPRLPVSTPCRSLFDGLVVLGDGRVVTGCCFDAQGKLTVGRYPDEMLIDIWRGDQLRAIVERHNGGSRLLMYPCSTCTFA